MKNTDNQTDKNHDQKTGYGFSDAIKFDLKNGFQNVFLEELKDIYRSEKALLITIPDKIKKAASVDILEALNKQLEFTQKHIKRLEDIFYSMGESEIIQKKDTL